MREGKMKQNFWNDKTERYELMEVRDALPQQQSGSGIWLFVLLVVLALAAVVLFAAVSPAGAATLATTPALQAHETIAAPLPPLLPAKPGPATYRQYRATCSAQYYRTTYPRVCGWGPR